MEVFVTTMYRYGDREKHSYVLGVWSSEEAALQAGNVEALWRGGKYEPEVTKWGVDANEYGDIDETPNTACTRLVESGGENPADVVRSTNVLPAVSG